MSWQCEEDMISHANYKYIIAISLNLKPVSLAVKSILRLILSVSGGVGGR